MMFKALKKWRHFRLGRRYAAGQIVDTADWTYPEIGRALQWGALAPLEGGGGGGGGGSVAPNQTLIMLDHTDYPHVGTSAKDLLTGQLVDLQNDTPYDWNDAPGQDGIIFEPGVYHYVIQVQSYSDVALSLQVGPYGADAWPISFAGRAGGQAAIQHHGVMVATGGPEMRTLYLVVGDGEGGNPVFDSLFIIITKLA